MPFPFRIHEEPARDRLEEFEDAAAAVGRSRATVSNLLRLLELADEVKALVANREIEMGHARALLGLTNRRQQADLAAEDFYARMNRLINPRGMAPRQAYESMLDALADQRIVVAGLTLPLFVGTVAGLSDQSEFALAQILGLDLAQGLRALVQVLVGWSTMSTRTSRALRRWLLCCKYSMKKCAGGLDSVTSFAE